MNENFKRAVVKNPMVWIFCLMMLYFAAAGLELEIKIPQYFAHREHLKKMDTDPEYAREHNYAMEVVKLHSELPNSRPEQADLLMAARRNGQTLVNIGDTNPWFDQYYRVPGEALERAGPPTVEDLAFAKWQELFPKPMLEMMLAKMDAHGFPVDKYGQPSEGQFTDYVRTADKCSTESHRANHDYRAEKGEPGSWEHPLTRFDPAQPHCAYFQRLMECNGHCARFIGNFGVPVKS